MRFTRNLDRCGIDVSTMEMGCWTGCGDEADKLSRTLASER